MRLFHLSDDPAIAVFEPRVSPYLPYPVVWAIEGAFIANYLLPRDCPRVCFRAGPSTTLADANRFLAGDSLVIVMEAGWMERVRTQPLFRYAMPGDHFRLQDANAGYWVSQRAVVPLTMDVVRDLPAAIRACGVNLRIVPSLWAIHAAVAQSSLQFSMIRMRNAEPQRN